MRANKRVALSAQTRELSEDGKLVDETLAVLLSHSVNIVGYPTTLDIVFNQLLDSAQLNGACYLLPPVEHLLELLREMDAKQNVSH